MQSHSADASNWTEDNGAEIVRGKEFVVEEEEGNLDHTETERIHGLHHPAYLHFGLCIGSEVR